MRFGNTTETSTLSAGVLEPDHWRYITHAATPEQTAASAANAVLASWIASPVLIDAEYAPAHRRNCAVSQTPTTTRCGT